MMVCLKFLFFVVSLHYCTAEDRVPGEGDGRKSFNFSSSAPINFTEDLSNRNGRSARKTSGAIIFPNSYNGSDEVSDPSCRTCSSPKKIPLKLLREISVEKDISKIFEKYVSNVKIKDFNGTRVLYDLQDKPIDATIGDSVTVRLGPNSPPPGSGSVKIVSFSIGGSKNGSDKSPGGNHIPSGRDPGIAVRRKPSPAMTVFAGGIAERFGQAGNEVEKVTKHAACEPELRTARVPGSDDPKMFIYPKCVRIHQCGGCCGSSLLSCEPKQKKPVEVQVQKFIYNDHTGKLDYQDSEKITMESHLVCQCGCRVKSEDCSPLHRHDADECQCVCRDEGRRASCQTDPLKQWNPFTCQCDCREFRDCNSGFMFHADTCECAPEQRTPINQNSRRRRERLPWLITGRTRSS